MVVCELIDVLKNVSVELGFRCSSEWVVLSCCVKIGLVMFVCLVSCMWCRIVWLFYVLLISDVFIVL